jgi:hypothetical protein
MLRGYPLHIRNADHRAALLRDCRYFHLRGLEQRLIPHAITTNPFSQKSEIAIRLEDVRPSGIQFVYNTAETGGHVTYARPFVDEKAADLLLEIGDESSLIDANNMRANFLGLAKQRFAGLLQAIAKKIKQSDSHLPLGQGPFIIRIDRSTDLTVDGKQDSQDLALLGHKAEMGDGTPPAKRPRSDHSLDCWVVRTGQWRLEVQTGPTGAREAVLVAVKLDVYTKQQVRNQLRTFL